MPHFHIWYWKSISAKLQKQIISWISLHGLDIQVIHIEQKVNETVVCFLYTFCIYQLDRSVRVYSGNQLVGLKWTFWGKICKVLASFQAPRGSKITQKDRNTPAGRNNTPYP